MRREVEHAAGVPREHGGGDGEQLAQRGVHLHQLGELGGGGRAAVLLAARTASMCWASVWPAAVTPSSGAARRVHGDGGVPAARPGSSPSPAARARGRATIRSAAVRVFAQQRVAQEREQQRVRAAGGAPVRMVSRPL